MTTSLHPSSFCLHPSELVQGVGFEPTYGFRRPGLQPGAINHSTTPADVKTPPEPVEGFEPPARSLQNCRSTPELHRPFTVEIRAFRQNVNTSNAFGKRQAARGRTPAGSAATAVNKPVDAPARQTVGWEVPLSGGTRDRAARRPRLFRLQAPLSLRKLQAGTSKDFGHL